MERVSTSNNGNGLLFVSRPQTDKRSVSPLSPSPTQKLRGVRLFRAISRRLGGRRSRQESRSPSSDSDSDRSSSSSGDGGGNTTDNRRDVYHSCSSSGDQHSNSGSDTSSGNSSGEQTSPSGNSSEGSSGVSSIRRVFQSLSLNGRSQNRKGRPKKAPKKILRAPVTYTYVKGLSGLPTQRVPKGFQCPCVYLPIPLHAAFLGTTGLNRCNSQNRKGRPKKAPKKILRAPVTYTYVKGLSGLPTQRVPKGFQCPCVYLPIPLHAAFLGTTGLNR